MIDPWPKIIQIIPAGGWRAMFQDPAGDYTEELLCLALVEDAEGFRSVEGVCPGGRDDVPDRVETMTNFRGYRLTPLPTEIEEPA